MAIEIVLLTDIRPMLHTEISQLIWTDNQLADFYINVTMAWYVSRLNLYLIIKCFAKSR